MDLYFKRHDGQAVTTDDFYKAMEDANETSLGNFKLWYKQAVPTLRSPRCTMRRPRHSRELLPGTPKDP